jgi:hypothetical protein
LALAHIAHQPAAQTAKPSALVTPDGFAFIPLGACRATPVDTATAGFVEPALQSDWGRIAPGHSGSSCDLLITRRAWVAGTPLLVFRSSTARSMCVVRLLTGRETNVELLCNSFGPDFCSSGNHARREASQSMVSRDWAVQRIHECIVGCPCRFCPDRNLGFHAIRLMLH